MTMRHRIVQSVNSFLHPMDVCIVRKSALERMQKDTEVFYKPSYRSSELPGGAADYLVPTNPRLQELKSRYREHAPKALASSCWTQEHVDSVQLPWFRGDNAYVWQFRDKNTEGKHMTTALYMKGIDRHGWMPELKEDGLFGAYVFDFDDRHVSRDMLDSLAELYFLDDLLGISKWKDVNFLDIGAGYGRLAHRSVTAFPNLSRYFCVDAIPESTFLSEYYLRFRGADRATVVPLDEIKQVLANNPINLATNIHSFSECTLAAVQWWLDLLREHAVKYLMIVPDIYRNGGHSLLTREQRSNDPAHMKDFMPEIVSRGYRLVEKRPKFLDANVQRYGVSPTYHYLFELNA